MKKYKKIFEDSDLALSELHDKGAFINCLEYLMESIIKPELYIENLLNILDDNKNILKKYTHPEDLVKALSNLYKNHKIEFKVYNMNLDSFIYLGSHTIDTIYLNCTPKIIYAYKDYTNFKIQFEKFLKHEIIHREQFNRINNEDIIKKILNQDKSSQIKYFSQKYEIMSYAWQIVYDFRIAGKDDKIIKKLVSKQSFVANRFSIPLQRYKKLFKKDSDTLKLLYKYIYMYLDE